MPREPEPRHKGCLTSAGPNVSSSSVAETYLRKERKQYEAETKPNGFRTSDSAIGTTYKTDKTPSPRKHADN